MNLRILRGGCALAAAMLLIATVPVWAEPETNETPEVTTTTTTTTTEVPATTTTTTTAETTVTTTTTTTEGSVVTTTTTGNTVITTTTVIPSATTTTGPTVTPTTTVAGGSVVTTTSTAATTTATAPTQPDEPVVTPPVPTEIADPYIIVSEPGEEDDLVYFCDTAEGHYPQNILNNETRYPGYTAGWWVSGRHGQALKLGGESGRYLRCSRFMFDRDETDMAEFTLSLWINWQGNGENNENIGQKLLCLSTQDLNDRWHTGDRLQWDPDEWYAFVSPHMQDNGVGLDGMYLAFENKNQYTSDEAFAEAGDNTTLALPTNEWHHIAVTMSEDAFTLYVDGHRLYACGGTMELQAMAPYLDRFFIGRGMEGDPMLEALIDDAALYPQALGADHIKMLAADMDPADGILAPTTPEYKPTSPVTDDTVPTAVTTTSPTKQVSPFRTSDGSFPYALVIIPGAILLVTVVLSLVLGPKKAVEQAEAIEAAEETVEPEEDA